MEQLDYINQSGNDKVRNFIQIYKYLFHILNGINVSNFIEMIYNKGWVNDITLSLLPLLKQLNIL